MNRVHHQRALHGDKAAQAGIAALQFLDDQPVRHVGHAGAAVALQVRAKKSQFTQLGHQLQGKRRFAVVFFDDGDDVLVHKLPRRLSRQQFLVIQEGIEIQIIHAGKRGHQNSPCGRWHEKKGPAGLAEFVLRGAGLSRALILTRCL